MRKVLSELTLLRVALFLAIGVSLACGGAHGVTCQGAGGSPVVPAYPASIFYTSTSTGNQEIFRYDKSTGAITNLSKDPSSEDYNPAYNRATNKIVFSSARPNGTTHLYSMDGNGNHLTQLTTGTDVDELAAFSPDGSKIAFARTISGVQKVWVMGADGLSAHQIMAEEAYDPCFNSSGSKIVFASGRSGNSEIWVCDVDGSHPVQLTHTAGGTVAKKFVPSVDINGSDLIVYGSEDANGHQELREMDASGAGDHILLISQSKFLDWPSFNADGGLLYSLQSQENASDGMIYLIEPGDVNATNPRLVQPIGTNAVDPAS